MTDLVMTLSVLGVWKWHSFFLSRFGSIWKTLTRISK